MIFFVWFLFGSMLIRRVSMIGSHSVWYFYCIEFIFRVVRVLWPLATATFVILAIVQALKYRMKHHCYFNHINNKMCLQSWIIWDAQKSTRKSIITCHYTTMTCRPNFNKSCESFCWLHRSRPSFRYCRYSIILCKSGGKKEGEKPF